MKIRTNLRAGALTLGIASLILPLTASSALAAPDHRVNFREFRELNPDLDKQAARQIFREARRNDGVSGAGLSINSINVPNLNSAIPNVAATVPIFHNGRRDRFLDTPRVRNQSSQSLNDAVVRLNNGVNLDLTSTERNIVLGRNLFDSDAPISIKVGNETKSVGAGTQVTAAEYVAVKQVLSAGSQSLFVAKDGAATGGSVDLSALTDGNAVMKASALTVASGVTAYGDFGKGSDFKLTGDLNNFGNVHTFSSTSRNEGAIRADDINNYRGATIASATNLTLDTARNLTNDGVIVSEQGLTLTAGSEIRNSGTVSAVDDLNLISTKTTNRGLLQSVSSAVTFNGDADSQLLVNNTGGVVSANNGAINVRAADFTGTGNSTVFGGDLYSRELNLHAGYGLSEVNVGALTGTVNEYGNGAHVTSHTQDLVLGEICLTGDPTYYNTLGNITITGNINPAEALVFAAAGDIVINASVTIANRNATRGFDITFIAGADIEPISGAPTSTVPPENVTGEIIITGKASKTGGSILFQPGVTVTSRSEGPAPGAENAGSILMHAFAGKNEGSGRISLSDATILAGGRQGGQSGFIGMVAGGEGNAIDMGTATVDVADGNGGQLEIYTAQPISNDKKLEIRYLADGTRDPLGAYLVPSEKLTKNAVANVGGYLGENLYVDATNINIVGPIEVEISLELNAASNITHAPTAVAIEVPSATLFAGGDIGTRLDPIRFGADSNSITTNATNSFVEVTAGTGVLTVGGSAGSSYTLTATTREVDALNLGYSPVYNFEVLKLNSLSFSSTTQIIEEFNLKTLSTDTLFAGFSNIQSVSVEAEGSIGTVVNPFETSEVGRVTLVSNTGSVFYEKNLGKTELSIVAETHAGVATSGELDISSIFSQGSINVFGDGETLTLGILDAQTQITVAHDGEKAKLIFATDANVISRASAANTGPVSVSLGPTSATPVGSVKGLTVFENGTGDDTITGNGLKAKKGAFLSVGNSDITINNGLKSSAFSIGKNAGLITGL